jgi:hypothetical protein
MRLLAALLILAALSILTGCKAATPSPSAPPTPTPDLVVRLWGGVPGTPNLLSIFDEAGVVADARVPDEEPKDLSADISATPLTETSVLVEWSGFICGSRPSLTVDRADDRLTLFLEHGPVPDSCAAAAAPYGVLLMVDPSIDLDEIEVAESRPSLTES